MGWYDHIKTYVWDDRTTPYLVPVPRLTRPQADKELFSYCTFVAFIYGAGTVAAAAQAKLQHNALFFVAAFYCATVVGAAVHLGMTKNAQSARYAVAAPLVALVAFLTGVINPRLHPVESLGLGALCLVWLRYTFRTVAIARAYPTLPARLPPEMPKPANPRQR